MCRNLHAHTEELQMGETFSLEEGVEVRVRRPETRSDFFQESTGRNKSSFSMLGLAPACTHPRM